MVPLAAVQLLFLMGGNPCSCYGLALTGTKLLVSFLKSNSSFMIEMLVSFFEIKLKFVFTNEHFQSLELLSSISETNLTIWCYPYSHDFQWLYECYLSACYESSLVCRFFSKQKQQTRHSCSYERPLGECGRGAMSPEGRRDASKQSA